jgi:hypothetical protein
MNTPPTVFAQIMAFLALHEFRRCVRRYQGDCKVRRFTCLLRLRFHHDQFVLVAFLLGPIPQTQGRHQAPYASRPAWIDPLFYPYDRRKNARCPDPRRSPARARILLCLGSGVSGLLTLPLYTFLQILSVTAFEKIPLNQLVTEKGGHEFMLDDCNQLLLFNL